MTEPARSQMFVVDRDPFVCRLMRQFLSDTWVVECFADGYSALDRVRRAPPAMLVTEILVPDLDGLALCRLLRGDPSTCDVPILVLSMLDSSTRAHEAGADGFLDKPVERSRLLTALRDVSAASTRRGGALLPREINA